MTNQVNQEFEKFIKSEYPFHSLEMCGDRYIDDFFDGAWHGYQAATQASESEINSLKQRVEELEADLELLKPHPKCDMGCMLACNMEGNAITEIQADNLRLREKLANALTSLEESQEKECRCDYTR